MRALAKEVIESMLGSDAVAAFYLRWHVPDALVVAWHNVVPDETPPRGDRSLHLPLSRFIEQVEWLATRFDVVALTGLLNGRSEGARARVVFTFDDAYAGTLRHAIPVLVERGFPATVFVVSGVSGGETFWWDALGDDFSNGVPTELRMAALRDCHGDAERIAAWAAQRGMRMAELGGVFTAAGWDEIAEIASTPGVSVGSHTRSHRNLPSLTDAEIRAELTGSLADLRTRVRGSVAWLAYPYGLVDPRVERETRLAGYEGALGVTGGACFGLDEQSPWNLPRLNVPAGVSLRGLRIRASGLRSASGAQRGRFHR